MTIILVGLNHQTAPLELREKLALTQQSLALAQQALCQMADVQEAGILSTCNRFEVLAVVQDRDTGWQQLAAFIAGLQGTGPEALHPTLYFLADRDAVRHLMRVAAGLDSMILGETQILGQVIQAYGDAQAAGLTGPILSQGFSRAIHAGKRARAESDISRFTTSVSHAAALLLLDKVAMPAAKVLVVGAGEMAVMAAKALQRHNLTNLAFINRSSSRSEAAAAASGAKAFVWHEFGEALLWADAVMTATSAPHSLIYADDIERSLPERRGRGLVFVDIAVPRDVELAVGEIKGVQRYDIDDLQSIVDSNTALRQAAVPQVEHIIEQELVSFTEWYDSREVIAVIKDLRLWANAIAQAEVEQALNRLHGPDEQTEQVVNRLAQRLVNKLLHKPTVQLRGQAAAGNGHGYAHALSELFDLPRAE